jgi:uncharacterized protein YaeQ
MKPRSSTSSPTFSIATFLAEQSRLNALFSRSNLARALEVRIKDGTLYVPRMHEVTYSVCAMSYALKDGYNGSNGFCVEFSVGGYYTDEAHMEHETWSRSHSVLIPYGVADTYRIETDKHGWEVMVWEYSEKALNIWARQTQKMLYENRLTALRRKRETSDEAIDFVESVLSRANKRLT